MELINSSRAPEAIGPYSHAALANQFAFCSGQIPLDPETMQVVEGGIESQTEQVIRNIESVLEGLGATSTDVVKTTIFLTDMAHFPAVNEIYARYFGDPPPARSAVQAADLPKGALVEIDAIARLS